MAKTGKLAPVKERQQEQYRPHMKGFDNRHNVLVNLLIDLLYRVFDPRIKY